MQVIARQKTKKFDFQGFIKLIRLNNLLIIVFTQWMIKLFLIDEPIAFWGTLQDLKFWALVLATVLIAAAGYIINDYYDVKIDMVNKPERVVVGKHLKRRVAMGAHLALNVAALWLAFSVSWEVLGVCFISVFLLWFYSNYLKRTPLLGNFIISLLTATTVMLLTLEYPQNRYLLFIFGMFAFFISFIREIVKDMEDVRGDATFGCQTLPIVWGIRRTKYVIYVFFFSFAVILLSTYVSFPHQFVVYLYCVVLPPLIWFFIKLLRADTRKDFRYLSNLCKLIMILGILSMMLV